LNDEGKETRASCILFIPNSTDRRIHISNTASRPETHPALSEGLLRAQAETASIDKGDSSAESLALENAARRRSITHNPHLGRFPFRSVSGWPAVSKSGRVGAPKQWMWGARASVAAQVSWCCRKLQSLRASSPMMGEGNQACGFG
jgi:hypothetical protein